MESLCGPGGRVTENAEAELSVQKSTKPPGEPADGQSSRWADFALVKLVKLLGPEKGRALFDQVLAEIQRTTVASPEDLLAFGHAMARRGGFIEAMAVVLQTYAILRVTPPTGEADDVADS